MKKIAPYILLLIILVGLFSLTGEVRAADTPPEGLGKCTATTVGSPYPIDYGQMSAEACAEAVKKSDGTNDPSKNTTWTPSAEAIAAGAKPVTTTGAAGTAGPASSSPFQNDIDKGCSIWPSSFNLGGCLLKLFYYTYFMLPTFVLWLSAQFFNAMIAIGLYSNTTSSSSFIPTAWAVVRDISNIFFILVLLYIAIQTILGIGHDTKKMIARVVIMALLINFSMFFTKIVIDTSNILALVFYNKLDPRTQNPSNAGGPSVYSREYTPLTPKSETDVTGAMYGSFDATRLLSPTFLTALKTTEINGKPVISPTLPFGLTFGILIITGTIMLFAAYTFFVAGFSFLGRMMELWILIIFSPFAFMSFTTPLLEKVEYIGWSNWFKKLLETAFMAPIFMFFMYLIFKLIGSDIFGTFVNNGKDGGIVARIFSIAIPALIILSLLLKATKFAKKGGGQLGEILMKGAAIAGGLALGAATGGAGMLLSGTIGKGAMKTLADEDIKKAASGDKDHFAKLAITDQRYESVDFQKKMQADAQKKLALASKNANRSFDLRDTGIGKFVGKQTGMDFNAGTGVFGTKNLEGGFKEQVKKKATAEDEKRKTYQLSDAAAVEQDRIAELPESKKQNKRATQYEKDKKDATEVLQGYGTVLNEKEFKEAYEKGESLNQFGLNKKVDTGRVNTIRNAKDTNEERRRSYVKSLSEKATVEEKERDTVKGAIKKFGEDFRKGMNGPDDKGEWTKVATAIATFGAVPVATGLLSALQGALKARATSADVIGKLSKGVKTEEEELIEKIKHMKGEHKEGEDKAHTPEAPHPTPAAQPAANSTAENPVATETHDTHASGTS